MKIEDIMRELAKQGVNVVSEEHKQQIEDYLKDKNGTKDKPTK